MPEPDVAREPRRVPWVRVGVLLAGAILASAYFLQKPGEPPPGPEAALPDITRLTAEDVPDAVRAPANPGYLGPPACAPCHGARVEEFRKTPHARACRRPQDGPMPAGFESGKNRFASSDGILQFEMLRSGREFYQSVRRTSAASEPATPLRLDLVYGANKADEVFFSWQDDRIHEMMAVWLHPQNSWGHTSYDHTGNGSFSRETTPRCLECHNTWMSHVPGTINQYGPEGAVLGVTCEKCHGPGREHAEFHRLNPAARKPAAVLHPGKLARERRIEVCTQCHGNFTKSRGPAFTHLPGVPMDRDYRLARTRHPEEDHVANQIKYLRESKCFQKNESMTCTTCHDPHRAHEADPVANRESCLQCHAPAACTDRPNLPEAVRDECIRCHMPQRVWINVHFHTENDRYLPPIRRFQHRIAVDSVARSEVLLEWNQREGNRAAAEPLREKLVDHWLEEVGNRRKEYRFLAAIGAAREAMRLDPRGLRRTKAAELLQDSIAVQTKLDRELVDALRAAREGRVLASKEAFERILAIKPDFALAHSKLGTLNATAGRPEAAARHLDAVAVHDPDDASGLAMLGWLAYLDNRLDEAVACYRRAVEIEPYDAKIEYHWGLALLASKRWPEAEAKFRKAIEIEPRHAGAHQGLSHVLREQGRAAESVRAARFAARLTTFEHADILVTLADAYDSAGREPEAAAAAARVLELPATLPDATKRRMESLRHRARIR